MIKKYDENGNYIGRIEENGKKFDHNGQYQGRIEEDGKKLDRNGYYEGRIEKDGKKFDHNGRIEIGGFGGGSSSGGSGFGCFAGFMGILLGIVAVIVAWPALILALMAGIEQGDNKQIIAGITIIVFVIIVIIFGCKRVREPSKTYMDNVGTLITFISIVTFIFIIIYALLFERGAITLTYIIFYIPFFSIVISALPAFIAEGIMRIAKK